MFDDMMAHPDDSDDDQCAIKKEIQNEIEEVKSDNHTTAVDDEPETPEQKPIKKRDAKAKQKITCTGCTM
jgi:hypothetical protein